MAKSGKKNYFVVVILVIVIVGLLVYLLKLLGVLEVSQPQQTGENGQVAKQPVATPTPTKLKQGKVVYMGSWGPGTTVPKLNNQEIDPQDPKVGQTQHVKFFITHTSPIDSVSVRLYSDNKDTVYPLTLTEGTSTDGAWTGSWTIDDKILYRYDFRTLVTVGKTVTPYDLILRGDKP